MALKDTELEEMFAFYASHDSLPQSRLGDPELQVIQDRCNSLWSRDYRITLMRNNSELCQPYPPQIVFVMSHLDFCEQEPFSPHFQTTRSEADIIKTNMLMSKDCRTRSRFPIPVININGKNIFFNVFFVMKVVRDVTMQHDDCLQ